MRKYYLYAAVLCSAAVLGLGGCSNKADAATTLPLVSESKSVVSESQEPTSSPEETTVVETVSGTIEGTEEQPEQAQPKADQPEDVAELNNWLHQIQQENEQKRLQEVARRQANVEAENGYD